MKTVIIAGGKGTRISSVASDIPKPMIKIEGKPVLEHELECLRDQGFTDIILTVFHLGNIIMDYFGDGSGISPATGKPFGVHIEYYFEKEPLGNAGALFKIKNKFDSDFLLLNADAMFDVDFKRFVAFHKQHGGLVTLFTHPNSHPYDSGLIIADKNGAVDQWLAKEDDRPEYYRNRVNAGLHVINPVILEQSGIDADKVGTVGENRKHIKTGNPSKLPGDKWGIAKITNIVHVPNMKTDANNQHGVFVSTDLPEENWPWPTSSWEWRDKFAQRLREYTEGLFWFAQNDPELPAHFRKAAKEWGLSKDEYADNGHFPRQVYVREGRRFEGAYFFTANDAIPVTIGSRPPIHQSSITASHYALDSHAVRKREEGRVHLDGFLSYPSAVYTVPYGVMVPKEVDNLLLPVPVSGSHIGFSTLRMEPCWMAMGQAAGIASALSIDGKVKVQNIDLSRLQDKLVDQKATLMYFKDVDYTSPHFRMVQYLGLRGYLPEWTARLQKPVDMATLTAWKKLSGKDLPGIEAGKTTRLVALEMIYRKIK